MQVCKALSRDSSAARGVRLQGVVPQQVSTARVGSDLHHFLMRDDAWEASFPPEKQQELQEARGAERL